MKITKKSNKKLIIYNSPSNYYPNLVRTSLNKEVNKKHLN